MSRRLGGSLGINVTLDHFHEFITTRYSPHHKIIKWNSPLPTSMLSAEDQEVAGWKKSIKPDVKNLPRFKTEERWKQYQEDLTSALESMGLGDMIAPTTFIPDNVELDNLKRKWFYDGLKKTIENPKAKGFLTKYKDNYDVRALWDEMQTSFNQSMVADISSTTLSTFLTSTRFHTQMWRGTQTNQIIHWIKQAELHNELVDDDETFKDPQLCKFLNTACAGTANLANVLQNAKDSRVASGSRDKISLAE